MCLCLYEWAARDARLQVMVSGSPKTTFTPAAHAMCVPSAAQVPFLAPGTDALPCHWSRMCPRISNPVFGYFVGNKRRHLRIRHIFPTFSSRIAGENAIIAVSFHVLLLLL